MQMAGGVAVNDDAGLEREADVMGWRAAIQPKPIDPPSMAVPYLTAQLKTTVNNKELAEKSIQFGVDFQNCHWAETKEDAELFSIDRTKNSDRGMINTVIKGNLDDIKGMVIDADAKLAGKANSETLITISGEYWEVNVIKSADDSKVKKCELFNGNVKLKGYLQKGSGLKITGVYG
jgi:hypothetical protein